MQWLNGEYYLNIPKEQGNIGLNVEEIFSDAAFLGTAEFKRVDTDKRYRIFNGELQYHNEELAKWVSRTIAIGLYTARFVLN